MGATQVTAETVCFTATTRDLAGMMQNSKPTNYRSTAPEIHQIVGAVAAVDADTVLRLVGVNTIRKPVL